MWEASALSVLDKVNQSSKLHFGYEIRNYECNQSFTYELGRLHLLKTFVASPGYKA